jgi:hypothetical protein
MKRALHPPRSMSAADAISDRVYNVSFPRMRESRATAAEQVRIPAFQAVRKVGEKMRTNRRRKFFATFLLLINLRPRKQAQIASCGNSTEFSHSLFAGMTLRFANRRE